MKRRIDFILTLTTCILIGAFSVGFFLLPDKALSEKENRTLAGRPTFTRSALLSGEYTQKLGDYYADQFPLRDAFVCVKAYAELAMGKGENNGVIHTADQYLIPKAEETNSEALQKNITALAAFAGASPAPVYIAPLPRPVDVFTDKLPAWYPADDAASLYSRLTQLCGQENLITLPLFPALCESGAYYRTDHHYTTDGAYQTYCLLAQTLGFTPYEKSDFDIQEVSASFCGTSMRTSGFYLAPKDTITLYRYENDTAYQVLAGEESTPLTGFYDFEKLAATDQYAVFLGGNHARVDITLPGAAPRPRLLLIRDSFADCIAPFLARHYDLTLIDLRYYKENVQQLVSQEPFDAVIIYQCITEFDKPNHFSYLTIPFTKENEHE
ncbi:MAG: hypothetical protein HFE78_00535 [Clostridiales bacterium]|nr:hypothetical protein [Clostridiales bacterium]